MSDGLARAAGGGVSVEIEGVTYLMEPLGLKDFATLEQEYLRQKPNPLAAVAEARDSLPPEQFERLLDKAYKDATSANKATNEEIAAWLDSPIGLSFSLWISIRKNHPEIKLEFMDKVLEQMGKDELERLIEARDQASGLDELGNSTGRTSGQEKTNGSQTGSDEETASASARAQQPAGRESA